MQTSTRNREPDPRSFAARKGHLPQLSISDDAHHVTEAIGYMYGDEDSPTSPHANGTSYRSDKSSSGDYTLNSQREYNSRKVLPETKMVGGNRPSQTYGQQTRPPFNQTFSWEQSNGASRTSPTGPVERSPSDTANAHFPLNDIDYESSPAAVAQELSNLQALRRMSMDVAAAGDPDLPQTNSTTIPSSPSPTSTEDDSSRLFWVPARLHPELAPTEFKSFLDSKAEQIKRRSGELSQFTSPTSSRANSVSSSDSSSVLRRKKSMLSRQIDSSNGYQDGAERLEHKRSRERGGVSMDPNLEELGVLVNDNSALQRKSLDLKIDEEGGDLILSPVATSGLKRSTRTKYQRTDSQRGRTDRATYAQRAARRGGPGNQDSSVTSSELETSSMPNFSTEISNLASTLKDPTSSNLPRATHNFSRPGERSSPPSKSDTQNTATTTFDSILAKDESNGRSDISSGSEKRQRKVQIPPTPAPESERPIPQIIEPSSDDRPVRTSSMRPPPTTVYTIPSSTSSPREEPLREEPATAAPSRPGMPSKKSSVTLSSNRAPARSQAMPPKNVPSQSLDQPSPLPGNDTNTSNLSFIPTLPVDKRHEPKKKEDKKSSWSWLLGKEETDKDKDRSKNKITKQPQSHDNTRLDVLQTSIDGGAKGRESLVLDREGLKLEEERKKESQRKTSSTGEKKEKESIFSSLFGGKKHKAEKDAHKKHQDRLSPEPPHRELRPDIDYNWTRFSILEERAIYRMAHIKLANPRRALYSQVLLSNFMYSYLAKVQQMHPQMNLPTSAKQQRKQKEQQQQQQQQQQPDEFTQYQRYQQQQAQQQQNVHPPQQVTPQGVDNNNQSAMYNYDYTSSADENQTQEPQQQQKQQQRPSSRGNKSSVNSNGGDHTNQNHGSPSSYSIVGGGNSYYHQVQQQQQQQQQQQGSQQRHDNRNKHDDDDDDMW